MVVWSFNTFLQQWTPWWWPVKETSETASLPAHWEWEEQKDRATMVRRASGGISAIPLGSICLVRPSHHSTPSLYAHDRGRRCSTAHSTFPLPLPSNRTLIFSPVSPLPSPALPAPSARTLLPLSFPSQLNSPLLKHRRVCLHNAYRPPRKVLPAPGTT